MAIVRNAGAIDFIPSENEWYKAAYYDPTLNGGSGGYWTYPTKSNTAPGNTLPDTGNNANYYNGGYTDPTNYLTPVGAFADSPSAYGTYDQGGDVWQWNEANISGEYPWFAWRPLGRQLLRSRPPPAAADVDPTDEGTLIGFRVASVPEPGSLAMLAGVALTALLYWWRKRA